jgi:hypothetical protein
MIRKRTLRANSLSSLIASGGVFAITLALSAVLARSIVATEYQVYATATAFLPLALLLSQSLRSCAGSALTVALQCAEAGEVASAYRRIVLIVTLVTVGCGAGIIEIIRFFYLVKNFNTGLLSFGLYCILLHVAGVSLSLLVTGPAAANEDFLPDNLLKLVPNTLTLASFIIILAVAPDSPLWWIFAMLGLSPWPLTVWLLLRYRKAVIRWFESRALMDKPLLDFLDGKGATQFLFGSLISVSWWNMTAYFATSVTIALVALTLPRDVVAFTMAFSLIGVLSGGLVAVSAPLASRVALIPLSDFKARISAFRRFNSYCILYILAAAFVILVLPTSVYEVWVGKQFGAAVQGALLLLLPGTTLRLQTMCFALFVMSTGRQSTLWLSPLVEALIATSSSFLLAPLFGLTGVAAALTLAATVRILLTLTHDIRLNQDIFPIGWRDFLLPIRVRI